MDHRSALDYRACGLMLVLCLTWSLQQISLKAVADDASPLSLVALRSGIAALLVAWLMARRGELPKWSTARLLPGLVVGGLFALEYLLVAEALRLTHAAHVVVFVYTAPVFAALGLHWKLRAERLSPLQWVGISVAFGGIALAFLGRASGAASVAEQRHFLGDSLSLLAGAAWGATTVAIRCSRLSCAPATETLLYQLLVAFVLLTSVALLAGQFHFVPTPRAWGHLAFQSLAVSFASFLVWFWLLRRYLASRLVSGAALVLSGILLVNGHDLLRRLAGQPPPGPTVPRSS
jgi:drug/metabolite transporter (DMT)-like permease